MVEKNVGYGGLFCFLVIGIDVSASDKGKFIF